MLAVIVLNWNGGADLIQCLKSVVAQEDCGMPIVTYVPDNASTDGSIAAVGREFPQARVIQNGGNRGFSGGNNPGWRQAVADGAEWVCFLNNDAALAPDCLRTMLDVCRARPEIGAASPTIYFGTPESHPGGKSSPDGEPEIWFEKGACILDRVGGVSHVAATPAERASTWFETPLCTGCCFLTTAALLRDTGGFDEGFFAYYEDVDLSLKIRARGFKCAAIPAAHAWHKVGQSTAREATPGFVFYVSRNIFYLAERHLSDPARWKKTRRALIHQTIYTAVCFAREHNLTMGATMLQGMQHALQGRTGVRPPRPPRIILNGLMRSLQVTYQVRDRFRPKWQPPAVEAPSDALA